MDLPKNYDNIQCVYVMYSKDNICLYVGRTTNLMKRMYNHFNIKKAEVWKKDVSFINYYIFDEIIDTHFIEIYLISVLNPKYNIDYTNTIGSKSIYTFTLPDSHNIQDISIFFNTKYIKKRNYQNRKKKCCSIKKLFSELETSMLNNYDNINLYNIFLNYYNNDYDTKQALLNFRKRISKLAKIYNYFIQWDSNNKLLVKYSNKYSKFNKYLLENNRETYIRNKIAFSFYEEFKETVSHKVQKLEFCKRYNIKGRTLRYYLSLDSIQKVLSELNIINSHRYFANL